MERWPDGRERGAESTTHGGDRMTFLSDVGVIDLMIGFPMRGRRKVYDYLMRGIKDSETKESFTFPGVHVQGRPGRSG